MNRFLNILVLFCVAVGIIQVPGLTATHRPASADLVSPSTLLARAERSVSDGLIVPGLAGLAAAAVTLVVAGRLIPRTAPASGQLAARRFWEIGSAPNIPKSLPVCRRMLRYGCGA